SSALLSLFERARVRSRRRDVNDWAALAEEDGGDQTCIFCAAEFGGVGIAFGGEVETARARRRHLPAADSDRAVRFDHPLARGPRGRVARVNRVETVNRKRDGDAVGQRVMDSEFVLRVCK